MPEPYQIVIVIRKDVSTEAEADKLYNDVKLNVQQFKGSNISCVVSSRKQPEDIK